MSTLPLIVALAVFCLAGLVIAVVVIRRCLIVVMPNEVVVLVGRRRRVGDQVVDYRVLTSGRVFRIPFIERVIRLPRGPYRAEFVLASALTRDNARVRVEGSLEVVLSHDLHGLGKALERFMGAEPAVITQVAGEIAEGALRLALSQSDGQAVVEDPLVVEEMSQRALHEAFDPVGLELATCNLRTTLEDPAPPAIDKDKAQGWNLIARLTKPGLSAEGKQAAVQAQGSRPFTLRVAVERTGPPGPGDLPPRHADGRSVFGRVDDLEVEVVYPASKTAEVELLEGGGLEVSERVQALRWDDVRQRLVLLVK